MYYQDVHLEVLDYFMLLNWLVANNKLYKTITIDIDKLDRNLTQIYKIDQFLSVL